MPSFTARAVAWPLTSCPDLVFGTAVTELSGASLRRPTVGALVPRRGGLQAADRSWGNVRSAARRPRRRPVAERHRRSSARIHPPCGRAVRLRSIVSAVGTDVAIHRTRSSRSGRPAGDRQPSLRCWTGPSQCPHRAGTERPRSCGGSAAAPRIGATASARSRTRCSRPLGKASGGVTYTKATSRWKLEQWVRAARQFTRGTHRRLQCARRVPARPAAPGCNCHAQPRPPPASTTIRPTQHSHRTQ